MRTLSPLLLAMAVSVSLSSASVGLGGCSYLEAQTQRAAPPDNRIKLGWQERVSVYERDVVDYTCERRYMLVCDRAGSITLSCTCVLR